MDDPYGRIRDEVIFRYPIINQARWWSPCCTAPTRDRPNGQQVLSIPKILQQVLGSLIELSGILNVSTMKNRVPLIPYYPSLHQKQLKLFYRQQVLSSLIELSRILNVSTTKNRVPLIPYYPSLHQKQLKLFCRQPIHHVFKQLHNIPLSQDTLLDFARTTRPHILRHSTFPQRVKHSDPPL